MLKAGSSLLCGLFVLLTLYVLLTLSGCTVITAMGSESSDLSQGTNTVSGTMAGQQTSI